jgi:hypothetical protein
MGVRQGAGRAAHETVSGSVVVDLVCDRCDGEGWVDGIEGADGSYVTSRRCPKCGGHNAAE